MSVRLLSGEHFNLLTIGTVSISSPDPSHGAAALYDGKADAWAAFDAVVADGYLDVDLEQMLNGGLDDWTGGDPDDWTVTETGAGAVTEGVGSVGSCATLTPGAGTAGISQQTHQQSGRRLRLAWSWKGTGKLRVQNLRTGYWLASTSTWQAAQCEAATAAAIGAWTAASITFAVEALTITGLDECELEITFIADSAALDVDLVSLVPGVTFSSIHGHNIDPIVAVQVRYSSDAFVADDHLALTMTKAQPTFWGTIAETFSRYWRMVFSGSNVEEPIRLGEWVLGQSYTLARMQQPGWSSDGEAPKLVAETPAGGMDVYPLGEHPLRTLEATFEEQSVAELLEHQLHLWTRTGHGKRPLVIVPNDAAAEVILGHVTGTSKVTYPDRVSWATAFRIKERPFPLPAPPTLADVDETEVVLSGNVVTMNAGRAYLAEWGLRGADLSLRLFANDHVPTKTDVLGDYTEVAGGGYAAITLAKALWGYTSGDPAVALYAEQTWTFLAAIAGSIYGVYLVTAGGVVVLAERFSAPITITLPWQAIQYQPRVEWGAGS